MRFDDEDTPRELPPRGGRLELPPMGASASNHPRVKVARVWHMTAITVVAEIVVCVCSVAQNWPPQLTIGTLCGATGLWAVGARRGQW